MFRGADKLVFFVPAQYWDDLNDVEVRSERAQRKGRLRLTARGGAQAKGPSQLAGVEEGREGACLPPSMHRAQVSFPLECVQRRGDRPGRSVEMRPQP